MQNPSTRRCIFASRLYNKLKRQASGSANSLDEYLTKRSAERAATILELSYTPQQLENPIAGWLGLTRSIEQKIKSRKFVVTEDGGIPPFLSLKPAPFARWAVKWHFGDILTNDKKLAEHYGNAVPILKEKMKRIMHKRP